jgi:hypothetical protein
MANDRVKLAFPGQDADCTIEPLDDGTVRVTLRFEVCWLTVRVPGADAMKLGHELRVAATHSAHLLRAKGGG